ncbi:hypothetical protein [Zhouia amylolytica]|uniref:Histidine kinase N-terminal 7TM region domain-containing protein n=2 Tax=Zhouia amylolytica TaxID=376730 RepID=W2UNV5_9FLAO|nr:hypothetical protein [Zhouia amylolytica]ETN95683.1 hypothetical protein P278_14050 [Zhouia amylolytica AD3]MCQ0112149.1 hypothetical protein [Zhouia amylolytica]
MIINEILFRKVIYLSEFFAFITALVTYRYYKHTPNKIFLFFLSYVLLTEFLSELISYFWKYPDSEVYSFLKNIIPTVFLNTVLWLGALFSIISFYVFLIYYRYLIKDFKKRKLIDGLVIFYTIAVVLDHFFNADVVFKKFLVYHKIVGVLSVMICVGMYMKVLFNSNKLFSFYKLLSFWISIGLLFFNVMTIPIFIFSKQLEFSNTIYLFILSLSCLVMYGSFTIGFIINAREERNLRKQAVR